METGNATAWSRGSTSRPPPEATAVKIARTRKPRHSATGSSASTSPLRSRGQSPARYAGTTGGSDASGAEHDRPDQAHPSTGPAASGRERRKASSDAEVLAGWRAGAQSRRAR